MKIRLVDIPDPLRSLYGIGTSVIVSLSGPTFRWDTDFFFQDNHGVVRQVDGRIFQAAGSEYRQVSSASPAEQLASTS